MQHGEILKKQLISDQQRDVCEIFEPKFHCEWFLMLHPVGADVKGCCIQIPPHLTHTDSVPHRATCIKHTAKALDTML